MIFVTVGTNEAPFDRLIAAVGRLPAGERIVVQTGSSRLRPARARCREFMSYEEVLEHCRRARAVVTHAGVGSVLTALSCRKRPVVVPRLARNGEAVDDHQLEWALRFVASGLVTVLEDVDLLPAVLRDVRAHTGEGLAVAGGLSTELRGYLSEEIGRPPRPALLAAR